MSADSVSHSGFGGLSLDGCEISQCTSLLAGADTLVLVFAKGEGRVSAWLSTRPMQLLASLSMPFYMTHQMLTGILIRRLPKMPEALMLFVCLLTILSVSWLVDRFFLRKMEKMA